MKFKKIFILLLTFSWFSVKSQIDSSLIKKITVSGFSLCKTTVGDLQNLSKDFKLINVEEMDAGKKCIGEDSRFVNGKGYYSPKYPGIIFQKDQDEDYISKIRITKGFVGELPNGPSITFDNLTLKGILKDYPESKFKWSSRDCSDYWTYSNDTISFFVKIDKNKKPQYPLDEVYYLSKPVDGIDIFISCYSIFNRSDNFNLFPKDEPVFFVDSIRTNKAFIEEAYQPSEISFISVYKDSAAISVAGKDAINGAVYVITKSFARDHYWNFFKSKSPEYKKNIPDLKTESRVAYILNDKILGTNSEGKLFEINDLNFLDLSIISREKLINDYHISDKLIGVVIKTK